jgi:hypothetical protein
MGWVVKPRPGRFTPWKETQYLWCRRLCGPQSWSERVRIISPPPGIDPYTIQLLVSRYSTDYAAPAHLSSMCLNMNYARSEKVSSKQSTTTWTSKLVPLTDCF